MLDTTLFKNISEEVFTDPIKFALWVLDLYNKEFLRGHLAVQPFAEELVERFFHYLIPLEEPDKKDFIEKFTNYGDDGDRYSFILQGKLREKGTSCNSLRSKLIEQIGTIRKQAEIYINKQGLLPKEEVSNLFYHLAHNLGSSDIYNQLRSITQNVEYFRNYNVVSMDDLENYLKNYDGKEKKFGCNPLEKFKQDKAFTQ